MSLKVVFYAKIFKNFFFQKAKSYQNVTTDPKGGLQVFRKSENFNSLRPILFELCKKNYSRNRVKKGEQEIHNAKKLTQNLNNMLYLSFLKLCPHKIKSGKPINLIYKFKQNFAAALLVSIRENKHK